MKSIKHLPTLMLLAAMVALFSGCGSSEPYSDVVSTTDDMTDNFVSFESDMSAASNAEEAASALNKYADGLEKLLPQMQKLAEKYPELEEKKGDLPENVQAAVDRMEASMEKFGPMMMKTLKYMQSPEFQEAQKRLMEIMQKMDDKD